MTNDTKLNKLKQLDDKILLIENTLKSLNEELARLKNRRQRLEEKYKGKSTDDVTAACANHEIVEQPQENEEEASSKSEQNGTSSGVKRKERKKWAENNYVIEVNDREVIKKKRKLAGTDQPYNFEDHFPTVVLSKLKTSPPKLRNSETSIYSTPPSSTVKFNKPYQNFWAADRIKLKQEAKAGLLKLNFKGANLTKIPGYGERVHLD